MLPMMYLEMSRDVAHGGGRWAFPNCIWAPSEKANGGAWPFWSKILQVKAGDVVLHLRGKPPAASFAGYSTASNDGYEAQDRPPEPGRWSFASKYYRADLEAFTPFDQPINLLDVFSARRLALEEYFDKNRARGAAKLAIFYVRQSGHLQCLNGAYLSDVDDELFDALFGGEHSAPASQQEPLPLSIVTSQQLATVRARVGQSVFAKEVKSLYGYGCCFPGCLVTDSRFLVASHIARWSDNEALRGHFGNGLCFCLMHDKAFEIGLFTLDEEYKIFVSPAVTSQNSSFIVELKSAHGRRIRLSSVPPLKEALAEHWNRVKLFPELCEKPQ
jgi:putative restriction endonuclease